MSHDASSNLASQTYARVYRRLLWPVWERVVRRRDTPSLLAFLEASQWQSPELIEAYQLGALRQLVTYAGDNVPYYRELFAKARFDARSLRRREELDALPVLTREIVRERYKDLVAPEHRGKNFKKGTSGSTGTPLKFEYSRESECWRQATRVRGYSWGGYRPGAPIFYYWAQVAELPGGAAGAKIRLDRAMKRETFVDSMKQDEASRLEALALFRATRPSMLICYTQSCAELARWIVARGLRDWPDLPVLCGAEGVLPADRQALARAFGPEIFETYGSRETMLMASECEAHDGMHLSEENLLLQVTRDGKTVPAGESGDVVVTDLHNYGMPFIRYLNGDVAVAKEDTPCRCGRGLRRIARVEGRRADTLVDREGNPIPGIVFHVLFSDARKEVVRQFQAVQKATGEVVLKVVHGQDWSPEAFDAITDRFARYLRGLPFTIEHVPSIPPAPNGKMKTIIVERA